MGGTGSISNISPAIPCMVREILLPWNAGRICLPAIEKPGTRIFHAAHRARAALPHLHAHCLCLHRCLVVVALVLRGNTRLLCIFPFTTTSWFPIPHPFRVVPYLLKRKIFGYKGLRLCPEHWFGSALITLPFLYSLHAKRRFSLQTSLNHMPAVEHVVHSHIQSFMYGCCIFSVAQRRAWKSCNTFCAVSGTVVCCGRVYVTLYIFFWAPAGSVTFLYS